VKVILKEIMVGIHEKFLGYEYKKNPRHINENNDIGVTVVLTNLSIIGTCTINSSFGFY